MDNWKYYNNAAIPTTAPHENADLTPIKDGSVWEMDGKPLFARWTEKFDCGYETEWWYCIKDEPFEFSKIKSKRRSEIEKGLKLNEVKIVKASEFVDEIYQIQKDCYKDYPEQYRPNYSIDKTIATCRKWDETHIVFIAFSRKTGDVVGFSCVEPMGEYINFEILKVPNKYKKDEVTAALTYNILIEMLNYNKYKYICDGARNVVHQTNFMEYLVKHFGFRYAYCELKMAYKPIVKPIIMLLYPFREVLKKYKKNKLIYNLNAVLKMEEISRNFADKDN